MNLTNYQHKQHINERFSSLKLINTQSGVVLFIALVALVVMSLAAVALIRSVDTNSLITGNLAYKQTAVISASYGFEGMADEIGDNVLDYGNNNDVVNGYYARCTTFDQGAVEPCNAANITADANWAPGTSSRLAAIGGGVIADGVDAYGNTIQYIVERMCNQLGPPTEPTCLLATNDLNNNSKNVGHYGNSGAPEQLVVIPIYRVTVRVAGPKNTVSYIQAFIS